MKQFAEGTFTPIVWIDKFACVIRGNQVRVGKTGKFVCRADELGAEMPK